MARAPDPELRQWWRELLDAFDASDLTVAAFCRQHGVSSPSFYAWRRRLKSEPVTRRTSSFVPVQLVAAEHAPPRPVRVHLPGGIRVDVPGDDKELLWELLAQVTRREVKAS